MWSEVKTSQELRQASEDKAIKKIRVLQDLTEVPAIRLGPGVQLFGAGVMRPVLEFTDGAGVCLTADNVVRHLDLRTRPDAAALFNDTDQAALGFLSLVDITTSGLVRLLGKGSVKSGHVEVQGLHIEDADATGATDRPQGFGVAVLQGALTIWNQQSNPESTWTANLRNISIGTITEPAKGSGIFLAGAGDKGGTLRVQHLQADAIYSTGKIATGVADLITAGVFTSFGAIVDLIENNGPVITYGSNDMVLDNWGNVDHWVATDTITSYGPSGIRFVNFGHLGSLQVLAPIETFGLGARGFNMYDGSLMHAEFDRIITHGDGSVGIQISKQVESITVNRGIETFGASGTSLVKGVLEQLSAIALSVKPGGEAGQITIKGGLRTHAAGIAPLEQLGHIRRLLIEGDFYSTGADATKA